MIQVLERLEYKGIVKLWYVANEYKLDRLVETNNRIDALAFAKITLWKNFYDVFIYAFHDYNNSNGVVLIKIKSIPEASSGVTISEGTNNDFFKI